MKKVATSWYVEPCDANTNEVIAKNLAAVNKVNENVDLEDVDGLFHSVFEVEDYSFITRLYKDRFKFNLRFNVFYKKGKNDKLRPWTLGEKKKKKNVANKKQASK